MSDSERPIRGYYDCEHWVIKKGDEMQYAEHKPSGMKVSVWNGCLHIEHADEPDRPPPNVLMWTRIPLGVLRELGE